jgi:hypothetical protein
LTNPHDENEVVADLIVCIFHEKKADMLLRELGVEKRDHLELKKETTIIGNKKFFEANNTGRLLFYLFEAMVEEITNNRHEFSELLSIIKEKKNEIFDT